MFKGTYHQVPSHSIAGINMSHCILHVYFIMDSQIVPLVQIYIFGPKNITNQTGFPRFSILSGLRERKTVTYYVRLGYISLVITSVHCVTL